MDVLSVYNVPIGDEPLSEIVQECPDMPGLFCAPAISTRCRRLFRSLVASRPRLKNALMDYTEWREKQGMERLGLCLHRLPAEPRPADRQRFFAAEEILIPIQCEYYALEGPEPATEEYSDDPEAPLNSEACISTILLTMYDARTNLAFQVAEEVREHFPEETLSVKIPARFVSLRLPAISRPSSRTILRRLVHHAYREAAVNSRRFA